MGWFRRAAETLNTADPLLDAQLALTPSIRRVARLEAQGTPANGVITGIRFSLNDDTTRCEYAVTTAGPSGFGAGTTPADLTRFGVRTQPTQGGHRLRLGVPVVVKVDGKRGILDWEAMRAAWGLQGVVLNQEAMKSPPDNGVVDTAVDWRFDKRLKKGERARATITALGRRSAMGMATLNWDADLRLADGRVTQAGGQEVPAYAQWFAAVGVEVPIALDPKDPSKAAVDWAAAALENIGDVGFDDDPPAGSIAAQVEGRAG